MKNAIPENTLTEETKNELKKIKNGNRANIVYRTNEYPYSFYKLRTINTFGRDIYNDKITLKKLMKTTVAY